MSAQMIRALRKRAGALQAHAEAMAEQGLSQEPDVTLKTGQVLAGRDTRFMLNLATEFRLLADEAEQTLPGSPL